MIDELPPSPVPPELSGYVDDLPTTLDEDVRIDIERMVELAFHMGYAAGHARGWGVGHGRATREAARRRAAEGIALPESAPADSALAQIGEIQWTPQP